MDISLSPGDFGALLGLEELSAELRTIAVEVPLLVLRCSELGRIAWRDGKSAALEVESRCAHAYLETARSGLRKADLLAHEPGSDTFIAVLAGSARSSNRIAFPADCRSTLARLSAAIEMAAGTPIETGWSFTSGTSFERDWSHEIELALEHGTRERERFSFFSTVGHELRTPLTAVRGYIETVLEDGDLAPLAVRHFLEIAKLETLRMSRLIDGMLDISLLDLRDHSHQGQFASVASTLADALNTVAPDARRKNTVVESRVDASLQVAIEGDRLAQILINLLENAVKHGRQNGTVIVSASRVNERYVEISIDDDGPGIPEHERDTVLLLTGRGRDVKAGGCGIGLAVVRLIAERVGGEIQIAHSALGGARLTLRIPGCQVNAATAGVALGV